jgi:uncharacterized protein DUF6668
MTIENPWLPGATLPQPSPPVPERVASTGATSPQPAVTPPEAGDQLRSFTTSSTTKVLVVGTHGGSAESTVALLLDGTATAHRWPISGTAPAVLLTCRSHARGLAAAQMAMRAWAAGQTPHIRLLGLAIVADAPGRLPKPLSDLSEVLRGGVPHLWQIPWVDEYRLGVDPTDPPRQVRKVLNEINAVLIDSPT